MPTTVTNSIGTTGRTYSTITLWEADTDNNLVTADQVQVGECYNDSGFDEVITISGATTDSTRYRHLTTATGQSFVDNANKLTNALRYNQSNGVGITNASVSYTHTIEVAEDYFRMSKLQLTNGVNKSVLYGSSTLGMQCSQVIVDASSGGDGTVVYTFGSSGGPFTTWTNCLFIQRASGTTSVGQFSWSVALVNCTFAVPASLTKCTQVIYNNYGDGTGTALNCAFYGGTDAGPTTSFTYTTCRSDDASPPTGVTTSAYDTTTGSGFENTTDATRDFRIKSTSAFVNNGTATGAPSTDIVGTTRTTVDIGCWEFTGGAAATSNPALRMFPRPILNF